MDRRLLVRFAAVPVVVAVLALPPGVAGAAPPPSAAQALGLTPIQQRVDYTTPTGADAKACTVQPEKSGSRTAWVVRTAGGEVLRRFIDTNADNFVDIWSYYQAGVEVYRDIDSDFNKKPDQYRWFNAGGTRWGVDENEDGVIDRWRAISAHEVAEEAVEAIRSGDARAFATLLLSPEELRKLGAGGALVADFGGKTKAAPSKFRQLVAKQKVVTGASRFIDFGAPRPGTIPAGGDGATRDLVVYEGASALLDNAGKPEQVQLGAMVAVEGGWRLIDAPQVGSEGVEIAGVFAFASSRADAGGQGAAAPSDKMLELMAELQKLDARTQSAPAAKRATLVQQRADLLRRLAAISGNSTMREQWLSQLADMLSAAVVEGVYPQGLKQLEALSKRLARDKASGELQAHVQFQTIWAVWGLRSQDPKQDYAKVQDAWLKQLDAFAKTYPNSPDTAEALLQLGMAEEFAGRTEQAQAWYGKLAKDFPSTPRGRKASGAVRRLGSIGKPISFAATGLDGSPVRLDQYRGKAVLIQYWATWCEPCKADMAQIKQLYSRYAKRGFAVIGVNLDSEKASAEAYLKQNPVPWKHAHDRGGLEGAVATEMGVMTLPLMVLIDQKGNVVRRNVHVAELDGELRRLVR